MILIWICMMGGLFFLSVGAIGLIRFPDIFTRAHAAAKCDTLGAILCLLGLTIYSGVNYSSLKLIIVLVFLWITAPTATHVIAKAAYETKDKGSENI